MAERTLVVRLIGDERDLERGFTRASRASTRLNRDFGRLGRGALVGTGALGGLGRAAAFASSAFIGGAGITFALRQASSEASHLNEVTSKSRVVFRDASRDVENFASNALLLSKSAALDAAAGFGALLRPLGLVPREAASMSIALTNLAQDLSSFSDVPVEDALAAIRSGLVGEVEPLRRFGVLLSESAVQQEALRETGKEHVKALTAQEKALARYTLILRGTKLAQGDAERTLGSLANQQRVARRNIANLEALIGAALNPTILDLTKRLNAWLSNSENQVRVQRDVESAVRQGTAIVETFVGVVRDLSDALRPVVSALGGTRKAIELLLAVMVAQKIIGFAGALTGLSTEALTSTGRVKALRAALLRLGALGVITIGIEIILHREQIQKAVDDFLKGHGLGVLTGKSIELPVDINASQLQVARDKIASVKGESDLAVKALDRMIAKLKEAGRTGSTALGSLPEAFMHLRHEVEETTKAVERVPTPTFTPTPTQRNTWFDALIGRREDRVQDIRTLRGQAAELLSIANRISAEIARVQDKTRKLTLGDELAQVMRERRDVLAQIAEESKQAAEEAAQRALDLRNALQFRALGLGPTGDPLTPGLVSLRKNAARIGDAIKGTFLDTRKTRSLMASIAKILAGGMGKVSDDVRQTIARILGDIDQQLKAHTPRELTKFRHASTAALLAGLGLTAEQIRALRPRLARIGVGGTVPATRTQAFALAGGGQVFTGPINVYGVTDVRTLKDQLAREQSRRGTSRRGPYAGRH